MDIFKISRKKTDQGQPGIVAEADRPFGPANTRRACGNQPAEAERVSEGAALAPLSG